MSSHSQVNFCTLPSTPLNAEYCANPPSISLFSLGKYGLPIALVGIAYIILFSSILLPYPQSTNITMDQEVDEDLLVKATILKWSPAAGRTVRESGLRGLPGLFLVSVRKRDTGIIYRAIGPDMVLDEGDVLYFTGAFENLGEICAEYGLEAVTNENDGRDEGLGNGTFLENISEEDGEDVAGEGDEGENSEIEKRKDALHGYLVSSDGGKQSEDLSTFGASKDAFMASSKDTRIRAIAMLRELTRDTNHGTASPVTLLSGKASPVYSRSRSPSDAGDVKLPHSGSNSGGATPNTIERKSSGGHGKLLKCLNSLDPATVVVAPDPTTSKKNVILIGINAPDRTGLLHDISKGLSRLSLQALRTEASVVGLRSISIWRCEVLGALRRERRRKYGVDEGDVEEIWSVLNALLEAEGGSGELMKQKGLRVLRTKVPKGSSLIGKTAEEAKFRVCFRAAIVAVKRGGGVPVATLDNVRVSTARPKRLFLLSRLFDKSRPL